LLESNSRDSRVGQIADRWARIDPVSVSEWIGTLTQGSGRDRAASILINRISQSDSEMAAAWAITISDEGQRNNSLINVYHQWMEVG